MFSPRGQRWHKIECLEHKTDALTAQQRHGFVVERAEVDLPEQYPSLVSRSRPARQCNSVDFPEPDGPMIAVNLLAANSAETVSSARTAVAPLP